MDNLFGNQQFMSEVKVKSGQDIDLCYQCQKCASGCSMARVADFTPNQILRMVQMGLKESSKQFHDMDMHKLRDLWHQVPK